VPEFQRENSSERARARAWLPAGFCDFRNESGRVRIVRRMLKKNDLQCIFLLRSFAITSNIIDVEHNMKEQVGKIAVYQDGRTKREGTILAYGKGRKGWNVFLVATPGGPATHLLPDSSYCVSAVEVHPDRVLSFK
jgi:hypothetical protein